MNQSVIKLSGEKLQSWFDDFDEELMAFFDTVSEQEYYVHKTQDEIENEFTQNKFNSLGNFFLVPDNLNHLDRVYTLEANLKLYSKCRELLTQFEMTIRQHPCFDSNTNAFIQLMLSSYWLHLWLMEGDRIKAEHLARLLPNQLQQVGRRLFDEGNLSLLGHSDVGISFIQEKLDFIEVLLYENNFSQSCADFVFTKKSIFFKKYRADMLSRDLPLSKKLLKEAKLYYELYHLRLMHAIDSKCNLMSKVYLSKIDYFVHALAKRNGYDCFLLKVDFLLSYGTHLDTCKKPPHSDNEKNWLKWHYRHFKNAFLYSFQPIISCLYDFWFNEPKLSKIKWEKYGELERVNIKLKLKRIELFVLYENGQYGQLLCEAKNNLYELGSATDNVCFELVLKACITRHNSNEKERLKDSQLFMSVLMDSIRYQTDHNKYEKIWSIYLLNYSQELCELNVIILKLFNILYPQVSYWERGQMNRCDVVSFDSLLRTGKTIEELNPWLIEAELTYCINQMQLTRIKEILEILNQNNIIVDSDFFITFFCQYLYKIIIKKSISPEDMYLRFDYPTQARALSLYGDAILDIFSKIAFSDKGGEPVLDTQMIMFKFFSAMLKSYEVFIHSQKGKLFDADLHSYENAKSYYQQLLSLEKSVNC